MATKKTVKKSVKKSAKKPLKKKPVPVKKKAVKKTIAKKAVKKSAPVKKAPAKIPSGPGMDKLSCDVVEKDGRSFIIVVNRARNFFDLYEMRTLVAICHSSQNEFEGASRLFTWLQDKRKDVISDTQIAGRSDQALRTVYRYLVSRYAVKGS